MTWQKPREIALQALQRRNRESEYTEQAFEKVSAAARLQPVDRRLAQELVYGVVRWQSTLDWLIDQRTGSRTQKPVLRDLLRLGLYQLFWLDRVPAHAAIHETVELGKQAGFGSQAGFLNAVLRHYQRESTTTKQRLEALKKHEPWLGYSHPRWLFERWVARFGKAQASNLMAWNNGAAGVFARVNTLKTSIPALLDRWSAENVRSTPVCRDWLEPGAVHELLAAPSPAALPSFSDGAFYIQDPSTLLAVHELDPRAGESVLDLCAAPGGKATAIASRMRNSGRLLALDSDSLRLKLLTQNAQRLGATCIQVSCLGPAEKPPPRDPARFDRVLVDAPCSNSGVMRRRIDSRWRLRAEDIGKLPTQQLGLLMRGASATRPGGVLVYSTCSIESEENEQVSREFLAKEKSFKLESERTLLPFKDGVDGAYVARFQKRN